MKKSLLLIPIIVLAAYKIYQLLPPITDLKVAAILLIAGLGITAVFFLALFLGLFLTPKILEQ